MERVAPGVITRKSVHQPVQTGLKSIDAMTPVGRGQRELLVIAKPVKLLSPSTPFEPKGQEMICIYVAIGQKKAR